ncbi:MAG: DUF4340 domain-containing protein, partial [Treponema sp.]|nr:DUF4340 domain-containing protein [Treponema sp.]
MKPGILHQPYYRRKLFLHTLLVALLALVYGAALLASPDRRALQSSSYVWLESQWTGQADRIELRGAEALSLVLRAGIWFVRHDEGTEYPAKQARVADLLGLLASRRLYPVVQVSTASLARLGLAEPLADRIVLWGGAGAVPLLDLLLGYTDAAGRNIYLKKNNLREVRSGEDLFSGYLAQGASSWYYLKLLQPDAAQGAAQGAAQRAAQLGLDSVSRLTVISPEADDAAAAPPLVISRTGSGWTVAGLPPEALNLSRLEVYIRTVLEAEGDGFSAALSAASPVFSQGRIYLELSDGTSRSISLGPLVEGKRTAIVDG